MIKRIAVAMALLVAIIICYKTDGQKNQPKVIYTHDFPKEMNEDVKNAYIKLFDKGKLLYKINCSGCHDSTVNGVTLMPAFTKEHLAQYELRVQNAEHEEPLSEMRVNAEELQNIMIFLTYYKKVELR